MFVKIFYQDGNIGVYQTERYLNHNYKTLFIRNNSGGDTEVAIESGINSIFIENDEGKTVDHILKG